MGNLLKYILPFSYFAKTRLSKTSFIYHSIIEWFPMALITIYYTNYLNLIELCVGYLLFISMYELGYVYNDLISIKFEKTPRKRFSKSVSNLEIFIYFILRIILFIFLIGIFPSNTQPIFLYGIALISFTFIIHNVISIDRYKIFTFIGLAYFRFVLPLIYFMSPSIILNLTGAIMLLYVFPRFLTYLASKHILKLENRKSIKSKLAQTVLALPITILFYLFDPTSFGIMWNIYLILIFSLIISKVEIWNIIIKKGHNNFK